MAIQLGRMTVTMYAAGVVINPKLPINRGMFVREAPMALQEWFGPTVRSVPVLHKK